MIDTANLRQLLARTCLCLIAALSAGCERSKQESSASTEVLDQTLEPKQLPKEVGNIAIIVRDVVQLPANPKVGPAQVNYLHHAGDGSGRLFVNDMGGRIYILKDEKLLSEPFLDMVKARGARFTSEEQPEQGLSSFAFHPDYARSGRPGHGKVYTSSTETPDSGSPDFATPDPSGKVKHHGVLTEWTVHLNNADQIELASRREVLRIAHPLRDHVMGQLAFNPNARDGDADYGMLYIGVGDGGNTVLLEGKVDRLRNAQDKSKPFGKILRINPLASEGRKYSIPKDNPFVRESGVLPEIWAYGLRNPQRFSWEVGGERKMMIIDIGQAHIEEVNIGKAGANYGWSEREGTFAVDRDDERRVSDLPQDDAARGYTYPAIQYGHDLGRAISGGYVYRGKGVPELRGQYLFGDIVSGRIFFASADQLASGRLAMFRELPIEHYGRRKSLLDIVGDARRADLRFGVDQQGEIYLLTKQDGMVRKMSAAVSAEDKISHTSVMAKPTKSQ